MPWTRRTREKNKPGRPRPWPRQVTDWRRLPLLPQTQREQEVREVQTGGTCYRRHRLGCLHPLPPPPPQQGQQLDQRYQHRATGRYLTLRSGPRASCRETSPREKHGQRMYPRRYRYLPTKLDRCRAPMCSLAFAGVAQEPHRTCRSRTLAVPQLLAPPVSQPSPASWTVVFFWSAALQKGTGPSTSLRILIR